MTSLKLAIFVKERNTLASAKELQRTASFVEAKQSLPKHIRILCTLASIVAQVRQNIAQEKWDSLSGALSMAFDGSGLVNDLDQVVGR